MDFPEKTLRAERPAARKSLVERAAAILDSGGAKPAAASTAAVAPNPVREAPATPPPPPSPSAPGISASSTMPGVAGMAAGAAAAAAQTGSRRTTRKQVELNFDRLREMGYVVPGDRSVTAEEIRLIKRPLLRSAFIDGRRPTGNSNLIMISSARPNEGKTFMAVNLALSMALEKDITVLLIDTDVAHPSIPRVLGFDAHRGLLDLLVDEKLDMSEVLVRTNIENLSILPAGSDMPNANELLASARMATFVRDIAQRYPDRVIIFDTAPVLVRTETSVLATHVGQVAFVIEAENTNQSAVKESLDLLSGCPNIGLVLNKLRSNYGTERFGQYYGKYYKR